MEWLAPDSTMPVRQGDLLVSQSYSGDPTQNMCLVITADCDISQRKFGDHLACLRVITLDDYIRTHWGAKKLAKFQEVESKKVWEQLVKYHALAQGGESTLTLEAAIRWVDREDPLELCEALRIPDDIREKFSNYLTKIRQARAAAVNRDKASPMHRAAGFKAALDVKDLEFVWEDLIKQARDDANNLSEEFFLLATLPHIDNVAAVVLLRELVGISPERISDLAADARGGEKYLREGRLPPTLKYAVSQAFGNLYSRIGIPADYEKKQKEAIGKIINMSRGVVA